MSTQKLFKTSCPGVYFIIGKATGTSKPEKIFYIIYRKNGRQIQEKAGRQYQDKMTAHRAATIRVNKIGGQMTNKEQREAAKAIDDKWTINRLWDAYKRNKPNLKSLATDENRFKNYILPYFGNKEPDALISLDVDRLRLKLLKNKKPGTVKNVLEVLRRVINFGVKKRLCKGLDFIIEMPKVNNQKTEDLTIEQLSNLLKAIDEDTNMTASAMMKLALFTGLRRGEMFKLKWKDIDFEHGFIHLREPKGGTDQTVPLNSEAIKIFKNHIRTDSPFVFGGKDGHQRTDIHHQTNKIKERAGLPKTFRSLHGLRHVFASILVSSGQTDLYTVQKLLTHKSLVTTQRYAHLKNDVLKKASGLAGDIIYQAINEK